MSETRTGDIRCAFVICWLAERQSVRVWICTGLQFPSGCAFDTDRAIRVA